MPSPLQWLGGTESEVAQAREERRQELIRCLAATMIERPHAEKPVAGLGASSSSQLWRTSAENNKSTEYSGWRTTKAASTKMRRWQDKRNWKDRWSFEEPPAAGPCSSSYWRSSISGSENPGSKWGTMINWIQNFLFNFAEVLLNLCLLKFRHAINIIITFGLSFALMQQQPCHSFKSTS